MENNNKESFKLLEASDTESISEQNDVILTKRKKRLRRRLKNNPSTKHTEETFCFCKPRTIVFFIFFIILTCWLVVLTWLATVLHGEMIRLSDDIKSVVAGSQGVPEALQRCHSMSRDLQKNQTYFFTRLSALAEQLTNVSSEVSELRSSLHSVQDQFKSPVGLANDPRIITDLSASVASFGSHIQDLDTTLATIKANNNKLDESVMGLVSNITDIRHKLEELSNVTAGRGASFSSTDAADVAAVVSLVNSLVSNLTAINETLSNKLQWTVDDQSKDHKLIESLQDMNQNITARVRTLESSAQEQQQQQSVVNTTKAQPTKLVDMVTTEAVTTLPVDVATSNLPP